MSKTDLRRAAVILASLPEGDAALLLSKLAPLEVEAVAAVMARLGSVDRSEQAEAIRIFSGGRAATPRPATSGVGQVRRLVARAFGNRSPEVLERVEQQLKRLPFAFLAEIDNPTLVRALQGVWPQSIALVLAQLPVRRAAEILNELPAELQGTIVRRIAAIEPAADEVLELVAQGLEQQVLTTAANRAGVQARAVAGTTATLDPTVAPNRQSAA